MKNYYGIYTCDKRIRKNIEALSFFTEPNQPFTRLVFSSQFSDARQWLQLEFEKAGLICKVDQGGNLIGTRKASKRIHNHKKVLIGSHIDTVPAGGKFDGVAGIVAGLESINFFNQNEVELPFDVELIDFLGEELNVWGTSCLGSRHMSGLLPEDILLRTDENGRQLAREITKIGGDGKSQLNPREDAESILACFELHIEQSNQLHSNRVDVGIVTDIPSISRYVINVTGTAGHSGTIKMDQRKDALVAASNVIIQTEELARSFSKKDNQHFVATIGKIEVCPNGATTVPGQVKMIMDLRASNKNSKNSFMERFQSSCTKISKSKLCNIEIEMVSFAKAAHMDKDLRKHLSETARQLKLSQIELSSGAGHDMAHISQVAPAAMVFIPCKDGLSHCPEEFTTSEAIAKGSAVITKTILDLADLKTEFTQC